MPEPRFAHFTALLVVMLAACAPRPSGGSGSLTGSDATGEGDTASTSGPGPVTSGECPGALATTTSDASGTFQCDVVDGLDPVEHRMLAPKAYFTECAGKPAAIDRFECVKAPFVGDALETCVEGF